MKFMFLLSLILIIFTVDSTGHAAVSKTERQLLIISNLSKYGVSKYKWLYKFLDASAISMAKNLVGKKYDKVYALTPRVATSKNFYKSLDIITKRETVDALDVIISLHGNSKRLTFQNGTQHMKQVKSSLLKIENKQKFRLLYNTACYGNSHSPEFLASGFRTAIGALKVNTASATEYPEFLTRFRMGHKVSNIIQSTNSKLGLKISDAIAKRAGFPSSDSRKVVKGKVALTIATDSF